MTKPTSAEPLTSDPIQESAVIDYLKNNPGLLERHPEVLAALTFTHQSGAAISLVERQLKLLRDENKGLKNKLAELVHIARENEELSQRFHRLSLELMSSHNLHDIIAMIRDQIQTFFYTDYVSFFFSDTLTEQLKGLESHVLDPEHKHAAQIQKWMKSRKPEFAPLDQELRKLLFGEEIQITSSVLIPLYHTEEIGLLALGSKTHDRFSSDMGTIFLTQLGDLVSSKLKHLLS
jgi:uncharacterized protein